MRDPFSWSIPLGRLFGITIRVHWLFPLVALGMILRTAAHRPPLPDGSWIDASIVLGLLFFSILLHEFGHCFMARSVGGEATEVLLWPLGGLANVELPQQPRAHFLTAFAGPAVNLFLALGCVLFLLVAHDKWLMPSFNLLYYPSRDATGQIAMYSWAGGEAIGVAPLSVASLLNWFFWVNYVGFVLNMVLVGFPLDAGRMLQASLWPSMGYRQATLVVVYCGYFVAIMVLGVASLAMNETLILMLALFVGTACYVQQFQLQTGEESLFGDFSQGYTSLERDQEPAPAPKPPRQSWWQRWMQQRAERKAKREAEEREAEERRMDELLEKVQLKGLGSLTEEERRFMKRVSERLRNRRT